MKRTALWLLPVAMLLAGGCITPPMPLWSGVSRNARRPVIAVTSFENRSGFSGQWQIGTGMADMLVAELAASGHFTVVERQHLESVVGEIRRQAGGLFRPEGRVEPGRLKNAEYLIRGVITDFTHVRGSAVSVATRRLLLGGKGHRARVAMTLTLVDVASGQILHSVYCAGYAGAREATIAGEYQGVVFGGDVFFRTPLGRATQNAIRRGISEITSAMPEDPWQAMIAETTSESIVINGGRDRGVRKGTVFEVRRASRPILDPASGDLLVLLPGETIGWIRVREVHDTIAVAEPLKGEGFARGQALLRERR